MICVHDLKITVLGLSYLLEVFVLLIQYLHVLCNIIIFFLQDPGQDPDSLNYSVEIQSEEDKE